jgi:hypothetical protein
MWQGSSWSASGLEMPLQLGNLSCACVSETKVPEFDFSERSELMQCRACEVGHAVLVKRKQVDALVLC